jgi:hypothetical protein
MGLQIADFRLQIEKKQLSLKFEICNLKSAIIKTLLGRGNKKSCGSDGICQAPA